MIEESSAFQKRFIELLKLNSEVLTKTQLSDIRKRKNAAVVAIKNNLEEEFQISLTEGQMFKKISNFKTRVKQKSDLKKNWQQASNSQTLGTGVSGSCAAKSIPSISRITFLYSFP